MENNASMRANGLAGLFLEFSCQACSFTLPLLLLKLAPTFTLIGSIICVAQQKSPSMASFLDLFD
jgi:hypothetical protein